MVSRWAAWLHDEAGFAQSVFAIPGQRYDVRLESEWGEVLSVFLLAAGEGLRPLCRVRETPPFLD